MDLVNNNDMEYDYNTLRNRYINVRGGDYLFKDILNLFGDKIINKDWASIYGFPRYQVSVNGEVRNGSTLKKLKNRNGNVLLRDTCDKRHWCSIGTLVYENLAKYGVEVN